MAKLYFYYSAMNAGKTTTLLQSAYNYQERGMETILFTPVFNTREGEGIIASRIGLTSPSLTFDSHFNFFDQICLSLKTMSNLKCIFIDEAQFLKKVQVEQLCRVVDEMNIPILAYGLRTDFRGEPFEGSRYLLAWAENIIEIKTICECGRKAIMNLRIDQQGQSVKEGNQIEIGGNERYLSLCRLHFNERLKGALL